jgi:hypothetical protein
MFPGVTFPNLKRFSVKLTTLECQSLMFLKLMPGLERLQLVLPLNSREVPLEWCAAEYFPKLQQVRVYHISRDQVYLNELLEYFISKLPSLNKVILNKVKKKQGQNNENLIWQAAPSHISAPSRLLDFSEILQSTSTFYLGVAQAAQNEDVHLKMKRKRADRA